MTTLYLLRHSKPLRVNNDNSKDSLQVKNEKNSLSLEGEEIAKEKLKDIKVDIVYASNYVRAIQTAKYISEDINVVDELGERVYGINSWDELPEKYERKQFYDENLKIGYGESQKEVRERMTKAINKILEENKGKKIAIVSHATAISYYLKNYCDINIENDKLVYRFNNKTILNGYFNYCETFKLEFDDKNNLINIKNINK